VPAFFLRLVGLAAGAASGMFSGARVSPEGAWGDRMLGSDRNRQ
jgi:hypothetical protein